MTAQWQERRAWWTPMAFRPPGGVLVFTGLQTGRAHARGPGSGITDLPGGKDADHVRDERRTAPRCPSPRALVVRVWTGRRNLPYHAEDPACPNWRSGPSGPGSSWPANSGGVAPASRVDRSGRPPVAGATVSGRGPVPAAAGHRSLQARTGRMNRRARLRRAGPRPGPAFVLYDPVARTQLGQLDNPRRAAPSR